MKRFYFLLIAFIAVAASAEVIYGLDDCHRYGTQCGYI